MRPRLNDQDIDTCHWRLEIQTPAEGDSIAPMVHSQSGEVWLGVNLRVELLLDEDGSGGGSYGSRLEYDFSKSRL